MFIKTVSTTSGINPIKFDETGGVFYWILNTGSSTIYASTKSAFTAGDDGVVSLGPKESRRLETNNDTIYILGEGQVEIHNQRDGICSFKQAPTSSGSGGGGTIDAYSKTESDAKYAQKTDIPSSLPANGGNADTVDGKHAENFIYPRAMLSNVDLNTILYPCSALIYVDCTNMPPVESWGTLLCYSGGTGSHVQLWATANDSSMFKRHYDGARWSDWKEISTTPIKSVEVGGTTDAYGNFTIWKASDGKIPIYAKILGYYVFPFFSEANNDYYYYLGICQTASHEWVANTAVSGTVYYIEI